MKQPKLVDLTHTFSIHTPGWVGYPSPKLSYIQRHATNGIVSQYLETPLHAGTHFDGQMHIVSGGKDIASVRVSADGGKTWQFARLLEPHDTYAWRLWEYPWRVAAPGSYTLMARATDTSGVAQPFAYDLDLNGFEVSQVQPVTVEVA